jgi:hypothetical protein
MAASQLLPQADGIPEVPETMSQLLPEDSKPNNVAQTDVSGRKTRGRKCKSPPLEDNFQAAK